MPTYVYWIIYMSAVGIAALAFLFGPKVWAMLTAKKSPAEPGLGLPQVASGPSVGPACSTDHLVVDYVMTLRNLQRDLAKHSSTEAQAGTKLCQELQTLVLKWGLDDAAATNSTSK